MLPVTNRPRLIPLVLCAIAAQAQLIVLAPTISTVARDFGTSVGVLGQARSVTAVVAVVASLLLVAPWRGRRPAAGAHRGGLTPAALAGLGAAASLAGSLAIALAPGIVPYLAAHLLVGAGFAALLSAAFTGVGAYPRGPRLRAVGWVTAGGALSWILVAPLAGLVAQVVSWRVAQAVPATTAVAALLAARWVAPVPDNPGASARTLLRDPAARGWVVGESVAYAAWTALLTYGGAYFVDQFGTTASSAGLILAGGAATYALSATKIGALGARWSKRRLVAASAVAMAVLMPQLLTWSRSVALAAVVFWLLGLSAGIRTPASAALGLDQLNGDATRMMTARTAATQTGYLVGACVGGPVIATFGYPALGFVLAAGLLASVGVFARVPDRAEPADSRPVPEPGGAASAAYDGGRGGSPARAAR